MAFYHYSMSGTAADGRPWAAAGGIVCEPADLTAEVEREIQKRRQSFWRGGKISPALAASGPYDVHHLEVEKLTEAEAAADWD